MTNNMITFWSKNFWPHNSTDLNPLDRVVWSVIQRQFNKSRHPNVASRKATIEASFADMEKQILAKTSALFRHRIEAFIEAKAVILNKIVLQECPYQKIKIFFIQFSFLTEIHGCKN